MQPGKSSRRRAWPASIATAAALFALASTLSPTGALAPASALAALAPPSDGALSPRLAELAKPAVRTAPPAEQAQALSLAAEGPGSLVRDGNRVLVEVRFDQGAAAGVEDLRQAGAQVVNVSRQYQTVTVAAKPDELRALNGVPRRRGATRGAEAGHRRIDLPLGRSRLRGRAAAARWGRGIRRRWGNEGRSTQQAFEVDGSGVTVGILSDSFNRATEAADGSGRDRHDCLEETSKEGDLPGTGEHLFGRGNGSGRRP